MVHAAVSIWVLALLAGSDAEVDVRSMAPHPVITEVLFHVPRDEAGDANGDGVRHATGDEFVELVNPHAETVNLEGYTLTNRLTTGKPDAKRGVRFVFPEMLLPPGRVVVVFNGCDSLIPGDPGTVGDAERCPDRTNERFADAAVLTMRMPRPNRAFSNSGDFVLLSAPDGTPIDAIWWGSCKPPPPAETLRIVEAERDPKGSVTRGAHEHDLEAQMEVDRRPASPGEVVRADP